MISQKLWLPGKHNFHGNLTTWEIWHSWNYYFAGNCESLGNLTSRKMWNSGKYDFRNCEFPENFTSQNMTSQKCDFQGNVTTWEILLPGERILSVKVASHTKRITGNSDFIGKCEKKCIMQIFGHLDMNTCDICEKCDHGSGWQVWPHVTCLTICDKAQHKYWPP